MLYTMLSVSFSDLNQALSLVGSSFLVKCHWKPNLKLASWGLHRKCCILQSISNAFNTLCGRSVAARRFIAAFVQLSMHLSYYTEWQGFIMNIVKELLELHCCSLLTVIVCSSSRIYIWQIDFVVWIDWTCRFLLTCFKWIYWLITELINAAIFFCV